MNLSALLQILLLACLWGPSFMLIKISVAEIPPITLTTLRLLIGVLVLIPLILFKKLPFPKSLSSFKHLFILGLLSAAIPFTLVNTAEQHIDSALAGIITSTVPIATAFLSHFFVKTEPLTLRRTTGIGLGLIGFAILFLPSLDLHDEAHDPLSILAVAGAAFFYAIGIVYAKRFVTVKSLMAPTIQLSTAALFLFPLALLLERPWSLPLPTPEALIALLILAVAGTALAFILYFRIIEKQGPVALSMVTFLFPILSLFFGVVFMNETLEPSVYLATSFILGGLTCVIQKKSTQEKTESLTARG